MTNITSFIHGIYPRSENYVQTSRDVDRKRKTKKELETQYKKDLKNLLALQKQAGFAYIEDGKLSWHDIFRPIVASTNGFEVGALTRWFDNNNFFRQPVITGKLEVSTKKLAAFFPEITPVKKWKVTLPSPFTFAKLSADSHNKSFEETLEEITKLLATIITYLDKKGVQLIQLNETYLPYHGGTKKEKELFVKALNKFSEAKKTTRLAVQFYFGDAAAILSDSTYPKIDIIGIDFYKTNLSALPKDMPYDIIAGIIEGRNSLLEQETVLKTFVEKIVKTLKPKNLYLSSNSDLELLPEPVAKKKIELLGKLQKNI